MPKPPTGDIKIGARLKAMRESRRPVPPLGEVGAAVGVSEAAVSNWERGKNRISLANAKKLSGFFGVDERAFYDPSYEIGATANVRPAEPTEPRRVPLLRTARDALRWAEGVMDLPEGERHFAEVHGSVGRGTFALVVEGASMVNRQSPDHFAPGDWVIIDPTIAPVPGDFVAAQIDGREDMVFRKYRPRGQDADGAQLIELAAQNTDWPPIVISPSSPGKVIGVMVEHRRFRRQ